MGALIKNIVLITAVICYSISDRVTAVNLKLKFRSENQRRIFLQSRRTSSEEVFTTSLFENNEINVYKSVKNLFRKFTGDEFLDLDPDAKKNMTQLVEGEGYPIQEYTVQTADGFLLKVFRIPHGFNNESFRELVPSTAPKPVVFLQHGMLSSSCDWVMNFAKDSLGFILADAGYDVWMGNTRGNTYSRKHVTLKPDNDQFWDWSYDEMAKYDLPAFLDFVLKQTNQSSLTYIGHSQGTTQAFALFSENPEYQQKIKKFVALAPVTLLNHIKSPIKYLSLFSDNTLFNIFGRKAFLEDSPNVHEAVDLLCPPKATRWVCENLLFLLAGPDISHMNMTRMVVYMNHSPAGISTKGMIHFAQTIRQKKFQMYDFGSEAENIRHYNQSSPPQYDLTKIKVPMVVFTGSADWLADPLDVKSLLKSLASVEHSQEVVGWNHLDLIWAQDAAKACYKQLLDWL